MKKEKQYHFFLYGPNEMILDKVVDLLKEEKPGKLLDVGSGTGLLCKKVSRFDFQTYACDSNPKQFQVKKTPFKKVDLAKKLPYPDNYFDFVTCTEVVEHLKNPWFACQEMARVTKKNGYLILSIPNFTSLISRMVFFIRGNFRYFDDWTWDNWGHINPITFTELEKILKEVNLKIEKIETQEKIKQPYSFFLRLVQKGSSFFFHFFKIYLVGGDRKDKSLSILESEPLLYGENIILKCKKIK